MSHAEFLEKLILAHTGRLEELKLREAREGYSVDPHVKTERREIEEKIQQLQRELMELRKIEPNPVTSSEIGSSDKESGKGIWNIEDDEEGFLDLIQVGEENIEYANEAMIKVGVLLNEATDNLNQEKRNLEGLKGKKQKPVINRIASNLIQTSNELSSVTSDLAQSFSIALISMNKAIDIVDTDMIDVMQDVSKEELKTELEELLEGINTAKEGLYKNVNSADETKSIFETAPRITTKFNVAKRQLISVFENYINEMNNAIDGLISLEVTTKNLLRKL